MTKILFSDYDGTIYTDDETISENSKAIDAFRKAGNKFIIATGRSLASILRVTKENSISYDSLIVDNGAQIIDQNGEIIKRFSIPQDLAEKIVSYASLKTSITDNVIFYGPDDKTTTPGAYITKLRITTPTRNHAPAENLAKALNESFGDRIKAYPIFVDLYPDMNHQIVDIVDKNAGKESAIKYLLDQENPPIEEICSVGDGQNDLSMLLAYNGFALETADPLVLEKIPQTTPSVATLIDSLLSS